MKNLNLKKYLISSRANIKQTIIQINKFGLKLVCVVEKNNRLIGTVSDGDVRRGLIKNLTLENSIKKIMNKNPKFIKQKSKVLQASKIFSKFKVQAIPVLDKNGLLIDIVTEDQNNNFENVIYIVAGGRGKRMMPLTKLTPKPLLEYSGTPLLESILIKFKSQGFKNIVLSINYLGNKIEEYFKNGESLGLNIRYIKETKEMGTAGSLAELNEFHNKLPVIMSNADLITNLDFKNFLNYHLKNNSDLTIASKKHNYQNPFGVITSKGKKIINIHEKPIHTFNVNAGVYILDYKLINLVKKKQYLDMPNFIQHLIKIKKKISLFPLHEIWKDVGIPEDLS